MFETYRKKSHSKVRATFTFWVDKSWSKVPKMVHFVFRSLKLKVKQYYQTCHFWRKIPKLKYSNSTFSAIFKHCEINEALIEFVSKQQSETFLFIFAKLRSWMSCLAVGNDFSWLRLHTSYYEEQAANFRLLTVRSPFIVLKVAQLIWASSLYIFETWCPEADVWRETNSLGLKPGMHNNRRHHRQKCKPLLKSPCEWWRG